MTLGIVAAVAVLVLAVAGWLMFGRGAGGGGRIDQIAVLPFQDVSGKDQVFVRRWWQWRPGAAWLAFTLIAAAAAILSLTEVSEFIYFQF